MGVIKCIIYQHWGGYAIYCSAAAVPKNISTRANTYKSDVHAPRCSYQHTRPASKMP